jgi:hypothetical protein
MKLKREVPEEHILQLPTELSCNGYIFITADIYAKPIVGTGSLRE